MAFPSKKSDPAPPAFKQRPFGYRCARCNEPLSGQWVANENDPTNPDDNVFLCNPCGGVQMIVLEEPEQSLWWAWMLAGALAVLMLQPGGWIWRLI